MTMKKSFVLMLILIFVNVTFASPCDYNKDNRIDIIDMAIEINGNPTPDVIKTGDSNNKIDIHDLAAVGFSYDSKRGDANYNPAADVADERGKIDVADLATVAISYGEIVPLSSGYANVYVNPGYQEAPVGSEFTISVDIETDEEIYAFDISLKFNQSKIEAIEIEEGDFLNKDGASTFVGTSTIDNSSGLLRFAVTRYGTTSGVSGNGKLFSVRFVVKNDSASGLIISDATIVNVNMNQVEANITHGRVNNDPPYSILWPADGDEGAEIEISAIVGDSNWDSISWGWDIDCDGNYDAFGNRTLPPISTVTTIKNTWMDDGIYQVCLRVCDDKGACIDDSVYITVIDLSPTAEFDSPETGEEGSSITFTDLSTSYPDQIVAWSWDFGDGTSSNEQNPSHTYIDNGRYTIRLTVTDDDGSTAQTSKEIEISNVPPTANAGGPYVCKINSQIHLTGSATDPGNDTFTYAWDLDNDGSYETYLQNPIFQCDDEGIYPISLRVSDDDGGVDIDDTYVNVTIGLPPVIDEYSPQTNPTIDETQSQLFTVSAHDPDDDTLTFRWYLDNNFVLETNSFYSEYLYQSDYDSAGQHEVRVEVDDGLFVTSHTWVLTVNDVNRKPSASNVVISPSTAKTTDNLLCSYEYYDPDGDQESGTTFEWYKNGIAQGINSNVLDSSYTAKGDEWICEVVPKDGKDFGKPVRSDVIVIQNTAPTNPSVTLSPDTGYKNTLFTCEAYGSTDPDNDAIVYYYKFYVGERILQDWSTNNEYQCTDCNKGDMIYCDAKAYDGEVYSDCVTSNPANILNSPPIATSISISDVAYTNSIILCEGSASDIDGDTLTYYYQFRDNGEIIQPWSTNNQFDCCTPGCDKYDDIICEFKASDGESYTNILEAVTTILNSPPSVPEISPTGGTYGGTNNIVSISCTSSDDDGDTIYYNIMANYDGVWNTLEENGDGIYDWDISALQDQDVTIRCVATDLESYSQSDINIKIDNSMEIAITSYPANPSNSKTAVFEFTANEQASFECKLDDGNWEPCSSPKIYSNLDYGMHTFTVKGTDSLGNVGYAEYSWQIILPDLTILHFVKQYPQNPVAGQEITFALNVENIGDSEANDVKWIIYTGDGNSINGVVSLQPGKGTLLLRNYTYSNPGSYNAVAKIDYQNEIDEKDESNNEKSLSLNIA